MIWAIRTSRVPWACGSATGHEGFKNLNVVS